MIRHGKCLAAQTMFYGHRVDFYLQDFDYGKSRIAKVEFEPVEQEGMMLDPSFSIDIDAAQELFEQLWSQGFRSKHDRGNSDRLDEARKEHLADLRKAAKLVP